MFWQRAATSILLVPLLVYAVLRAPAMVFMAVFAVILLLTANEWLGVIAVKTLWRQASFLGMLALLFYTGCQYIAYGDTAFSVAVVLVFLVEVALLCYPQRQQWLQHTGFSLALGMLTLLLWGVSFVALWRQSRYALLFLLFLVWLVDSVAYGAGRLWGKRKLVPKISPNKTWLGLWVAMAAGMILGLIVFYWWPFFTFKLWLWLSIVVCTLLTSVVGDLLVSMLKRAYAVKDTGHLLPGHGGVLDRLDSLIAATPVFWCLLTHFSGM